MTLSIVTMIFIVLYISFLLDITKLFKVEIKDILCLKSPPQFGHFSFKYFHTVYTKHTFIFINESH